MSEIFLEMSICIKIILNFTFIIYNVPISSVKIRKLHVHYTPILFFCQLSLYNSGCSVNFICRRYHISKASLMRWNKRFDGTKASLRDKFHRLITPHPNAHTQTGLKWIKDLHRRNPHISVCEMYGKLRSQKGYSRHPGSLYRIYNALGFSSKAPSTKKK